MRKFLIDETLVKNILSYLINKPYAEVYQLINILQGLKDFKESDSQK